MVRQIKYKMTDKKKRGKEELLPNRDKKMENPLENNKTSCPQDEVREPKQRESLRVIPKQNT